MKEEWQKLKTVKDRSRDNVRYIDSTFISVQTAFLAFHLNRIKLVSFISTGWTLYSNIQIIIHTQSILLRVIAAGCHTFA